MSHHHHRSQHSHRPHAARHHRHHKAAVTGAAVAGAGVAAAPFMSERVGQLTEEALGHVPKPMLAGLAVGVMVGAPLGYLWRKGENAPEGGHTDRVSGERQAVKADGPVR